jgi:hypothetical protein
MKKGFLLGRRAAVPSTQVLISMAAASTVASPHVPVDNLLLASAVKERKAAGGVSHVVRIECDFVTCSQ